MVSKVCFSSNISCINPVLTITLLFSTTPPYVIVAKQCNLCFINLKQFVSEYFRLAKIFPIFESEKRISKGGEGDVI